MPAPRDVAGPVSAPRSGAARRPTEIAKGALAVALAAQVGLAAGVILGARPMVRGAN